MAAFIVAASPLAGHTLPLLQLAGRLKSAGHIVTFVGGRRFLPRARQLGLRACALTGAAGFDDRHLDGLLADSAALPAGLERLNAETMRIFGDPIPDQHQAVQGLLHEDPDQVLITDILFAGAFPAACGAGRRPRRWISVGIAPVYVRSADTTPFGPAPVDAGEDSAAANRRGFDEFTGALRPALEHVMSIVRDLGGNPSVTDWVSTLYDLPDVTAQLSVAEFEFPRTDLPQSIHYVGILPPVCDEWQPPRWWDELDGSRPVVLVTQGTVANRDLTELVGPTLGALGGGDHLVVAALGRPVADLDGPVPDNVRVVDHVPFDRVLPHTDVFVTNGGFGATQQALAAGVPVVVAGATEDKPATAARVAYHGVGIDLQTQRPTAEQVRTAVRTVLNDHGFRDRAAVLAGAYAEHDAVALIQELALAPVSACATPPPMPTEEK